MVSKIFFKNAQRNYEEMLAVLERIGQSEDNQLLRFENCLMEIDIAIRKLKEQVRKHQFDSIAEEVFFFKEIKPRFIAEYIFYSEILKIESNKPQRGYKATQKFYSNQLKEIESRFEEDREFYQYYIRGATYLDHKYFVRHSYDLKMELPQLLYSFDDLFTTSHDFKIAGFLANEKIAKFINVQLSAREDSQGHLFNRKKLDWTSSKVDLVELIYAIHLSKSINAGALSLKQTISIFEDLLNVDLDNFHKVLTEIKLRKNKRTKFLSLLQDNLNQYFIDSDA